MKNQQPKLYRELAEWFHVLTAPKDYAEEAAFYQKVILDNSIAPVETLLELGSGGGNNASFLKKRFKMTLVDLSPGMLDVSRSLNPECEHQQGDMRTVRLERLFDCVFIHDAIVYMTTAEDLSRAIVTAYEHCKPGSIALFAPDCTRETFREVTSHGGHDAGTRSLRYLEWLYDPDPNDSMYVSDMVYLLKEGKETTRCIHDRHICGMFRQEEWLTLIRNAGFEALMIPFVHSEIEPDSVHVFIGKKV